MRFHVLLNAEAEFVHEMAFGCGWLLWANFCLQQFGMMLRAHGRALWKKTHLRFAEKERNNK